MTHRITNIRRIAIGLTAAIATACSGSDASRIDSYLREADMAVADGDMTAATSIAEKLSGDHMDALTTRQLCHLSLLYMQMADSANQSENIAGAAECYRRAFDTAPDSARYYYSHLSPEHTARTHMLATIAGSIDSAASGESEADTIPYELLTDDSHDQ